ncbi:Iron-sulfur assembly protein [Nymphaea thermarum]|nr:Iron-sulfur assembly protein [Nymphaea thermarum]
MENEWLNADDLESLETDALKNVAKRQASSSAASPAPSPLKYPSKLLPPHHRSRINRSFSISVTDQESITAFPSPKRSTFGFCFNFIQEEVSFVKMSAVRFTYKWMSFQPGPVLVDMHLGAEPQCGPDQPAAVASESFKPAISLTNNALKQLNKMRSECKADLCLRIGVKQGGCSGMSYLMDFEDQANMRPDDSVIEYDGFVIVGLIAVAIRRPSADYDEWLRWLGRLPRMVRMMLGCAQPPLVEGLQQVEVALLAVRGWMRCRSEGVMGREALCVAPMWSALLAECEGLRPTWLRDQLVGAADSRRWTVLSNAARLHFLAGHSGHGLLDSYKGAAPY